MTHQIYCPIRKAWFAALPEERVRQALLSDFINRLGYPLGLIAVEKALSQFVHLAAIKNLPKRRLDLVVFGKSVHPSYPLYPLLVVECKAVVLTEKVLRQVVGYNHFIGAPFIGVANENASFLALCHTKTGQFSFEEGFPSYSDLVSRAIEYLN